MLEAVLATAERTWQALAWDASARVAINEGDITRADGELKTALDLMQGFDVPLASWRVHKTAAHLSSLYSNLELRDFHLARARGVVLSLLKSLDSRPALREIFRYSPAVSETLGDDQEVAAGSK